MATSSWPSPPVGSRAPESRGGGATQLIGMPGCIVSDDGQFLLGGEPTAAYAGDDFDPGKHVGHRH